MKNTYLDWAATSPIDPEIVSQMHNDRLRYIGNPSSPHRFGREANSYLEESRRRCGEALGVEPEKLVFTSGGTESDVIPLLSLMRKNRHGGDILLSSIEHSAIYELAPVFRDFGFRVNFVHPDERGIIRPDAVEDSLTPDTIAVAIMLVNNETGAVQPIRGISRVVQDFMKRNGRPIHFHCDAVQAPGKVSLELSKLGVDSAAFSAHKLRGPRGSGLLYLDSELPVLSSGGGQERGLRPGTEDPASAAAMAVAFKSVLDNFPKNYAHAHKLCTTLHDSLDGEEYFPVPTARFKEPEIYSPFIVSLSFPPIPGEVIARVLSDRGYMVGTGSACSSNRRKKKQRVLEAMGLSEDIARSTIRVSFGSDTTVNEVNSFAEVLLEEIKLLRKSLQKKH